MVRLSSPLATSRNSSLLTILQDVKEPLDCSKRVGHGAPGPVLYIVLGLGGKVLGNISFL